MTPPSEPTAADERAAIVAWLRVQEQQWFQPRRSFRWRAAWKHWQAGGSLEVFWLPLIYQFISASYGVARSAIARGDHHKGDSA